MKTPRLTTRAHIGGFDSTMTPMIDTIFLLLIYFLCTASFAAPERLLRADLPDNGQSKALSASPPPTETIVIRVQTPGASPELFLGERPILDTPELSSHLKRLASVSRSLPVTLIIAGETPLERVVDVVDRCRGAGFAQVRFAARAAP